MHHAFEIETPMFKGVAPRPNAVNQLIGGDELCAWIHARLASCGIELSEAWPEDHGWDFEARLEDRS